MRYWFPDTGTARLRQGFTKSTLRFNDTIHAREDRQKADKARTKLLQKWTACAKADYRIGAILIFLNYTPPPQGHPKVKEKPGAATEADPGI